MLLGEIIQYLDSKEMIVDETTIIGTKQEIAEYFKTCNEPNQPNLFDLFNMEADVYNDEDALVIDIIYWDSTKFEITKVSVLLEEKIDEVKTEYLDCTLESELTELLTKESMSLDDLEKYIICDNLLSCWNCGKEHYSYERKRAYNFDTGETDVFCSECSEQM